MEVTMKTVSCDMRDCSESVTLEPQDNPIGWSHGYTFGLSKSYHLCPNCAVAFFKHITVSDT